MPWTFAHPAAILPLRPLCPRWLSWPGLVLGAMAPDLSYYVGLHSRGSAFCHTALGVVTVCLPVSLVLLALLHRQAGPLTVLLPEPHRTRVRGALRLPARAAWVQVAVAVLSVLIGAATHLLWDSFTHQGRWGAELLRTALGRQLHIASLLQDVSTVLGVAVLAIAYRGHGRAQPPAPPAADDRQRSRLLRATLALAIAIGAGSAWVLTPATLPAHEAHRIVRGVVWSTSCFATLYVVASVAWWWRRRDR